MPCASMRTWLHNMQTDMKYGDTVMDAVYLPDIVGAGYHDFWHCRLRYRVVKGGKASKKSSTAALWFIYHLMKYPEANLMVVRKVSRTHLDSTYAQLLWAIHRLRADALWKAGKEPLELCYRPTGQRILFRGFDNADKLASTTVDRGYLCWVWLEEAYEIDAEREFDKLDLTMPRGQMPPGLFKQTTITFNPWSENHWLKRRFFDSPGENTLAMTTDYRCNEFLDDTDRAAFEEMRRSRPRQYAVAGLGQWGVAEGLVFDRWKVEDFRPAELPENCIHIFGLDYGYTNDPTAFIAAAADMERGILYIYDEHYEKRMLNRDIAAMLMRKGYGKEVIRADSAEPKSNEELRQLGIRRLRAAAKGPDSVINGISRLQAFDMVVHPACIHTAAELAAYAWEKDRAGKTLNRPADSQNHLMDALRYAAESLEWKNRPASLRLPGMGTAGIRGEDVSGMWAGYR